MSEAESGGDAALFPERVGDRLRAARIKAGLDLSDVAARTRVPLRHLTALETGDYASLPAPTYSVGFAKSYARAVGLDENDVASSLRDEVGHRTVNERLEAPDFDEVESGPLAPKWLAWTAAGLFVLAALGYGLFSGRIGGGGPDEPAPAQEEVVPETPPAAPPAAQPAAAPQGQVVLTAKSEVWLRVYDANNTTLFMNTLAAGQSYQVPATATKPMVKTGRADQITVTVGGKEVAPLGPPEKTIRDVELTAASLNARAAPVPAPVAGAAPPAAAPVQNGAAPAPQP